MYIKPLLAYGSTRLVSSFPWWLSFAADARGVSVSTNRQPPRMQRLPARIPRHRGNQRVGFLASGRGGEGRAQARATATTAATTMTMMTLFT